jgi:NAD+--asparagine ADP-ribosyltransferase
MTATPVGASPEQQHNGAVSRLFAVVGHIAQVPALALDALDDLGRAAHRAAEAELVAGTS